MSMKVTAGINYFQRGAQLDGYWGALSQAKFKNACN